ncbi:MAG: thiamine phosphate synthase [Planctomycetota bacterium]|nr:MAG: thiamine phosphate synthase [Planctomycetota bacterium]
MTARPHPPRLIAVSPGTLVPARVDAFADAAAGAVAAGLRGVLLREPGLADGAFLALARRLAALLRPAAGWLAVHDRVHLATAAKAQAAHVGFRSLPLAEARVVLGEDLALGFSSHAVDDADTWRGADYLFFGPVFDTPSKRGVVEPTGTALLRECVASTELPVVAIGGLAPEHAAEILATGAAGMAVLGGVFGANDPAAAARAYLAAIAAAEAAGVERVEP